MAGPLGINGHKGERTVGFFPSKPPSTSNNALAGNSRKHSSWFEPLGQPNLTNKPRKFADLNACFLNPLSPSLPICFLVFMLEVSSSFGSSNPGVVKPNIEAPHFSPFLPVGYVLIVRFGWCQGLKEEGHVHCATLHDCSLEQTTGPLVHLATVWKNLGRWADDVSIH